MKNLKTVLATTLAVAAVVALIILQFADITYTSDTSANYILSLAVPRLVASAAVTAAALITGFGGIFALKIKALPAVLLWCIPCFLVALANFPCSALITGLAKIDRTDLLPLLILNCLAIGYLEEILFRGILQDALSQFFVGKKRAALLTVLTTSAVFAAFHFLNLLSGADIGSTLLQVGYSFLIGAMLSAIILRGGNIWICVFIHALFDLGGEIVPTLGYGEFQDVAFWILTAVFGTVCLVHVVLFIIKKDNKNN